MRGVVILIITILGILPSVVCLAGSGSGHKLKIDDVKEVILVDSEINYSNLALEKINSVLAHLEKRQGKYRSEGDFLEYLYFYTHRKLLKTYTQYPTLEETLLNGDYDCLTATAIYSLLLSELSIEHAVIETNYHIYILVNPDTENQFLIETTDPRNGFIADQDEIQASRNEYLKNNLSERNTLISFDFNIERRLEHKELLGLLFYNQSIKELNSGHWEKARAIAHRALEYYSATRVSTLVNIIDSPQM